MEKETFRKIRQAVFEGILMAAFVVASVWMVLVAIMYAAR